MAGITTNGIGSGLDINSLVSQLVEAEVTPARERLDREQATALAKISSFGLIKNALAELRTAVDGVASASAFAAGKVTSSNEEILTATASGNVSGGGHSVDVKRLADYHRLVTGLGLTSENGVVGTGRITIGVGGDTFDIDVDSSNNTLAGIRDAINQASANTGVTASILKVDDGSGGKAAKLVLTADETGESSRLTVTVADDDGDQADTEGLSFLAQANLVDRSPVDLDAEIEIDGETVTSDSNVIADVIEGLSLTLVKADPGNPVTLSASEDRSVAVEKVQALVDAFNGVISVLRESTVVAGEGGQNGVLVGDATTRLIESRLRAVLGDEANDVNSLYHSLASIGVRTGDDGLLTLDTADLNTALGRDFDGVVALFSDEKGIAARMDAQLEQYLGFNSLLDARAEGFNAQLGDINARRATLGLRESSLSSRLLAQFSAMDSLVASLQATGDFLTRQLEALNGGKN